jgi:aspartate-semialdehyde dehydrogenase
MSRKLPASPKIGVLGATGAVGRVMLDVLWERRFPHSEVRAIATARSAGREISFGDGTLIVEAIGQDSFKDLDLVLVDTPDEAARDLVPLIVEAGAIAVDNSAAWRMEPHVPLVVPEINPGEIERHVGIVASPNCTTIGVVVPLNALHQRYGLSKAIVSSYQAVSGAGQGGTEELREQTVKVADDVDRLAAGEYSGPDPKLFPAPVAFNVVPLIGTPQQEGFTNEEWKLLYESRKIMGLPSLDVTGTCVRVPTVVGHGSAVWARFENKIDPAEATEALRRAPGVEVVDLPTTLLAAGKDPCFVGRIRRDPKDPNALWFFVVSDNLRKGAALNAVQIAELLLP